MEQGQELTTQRNVWLLVRVDNIFFTPKQTEQLKSNLAWQMFHRSGDTGEISGTHGVKIGFYTSLARALKAENIIRQNWNDKLYFGTEIIKFRLRSRVPSLPEETTWGGINSFATEQYIKKKLPSFEGARLLKHPKRVAYLMVEPLDYHGKDDSRRMELYAFKHEQTVKEAISEFSQAFPGSKFGYMILPVNIIPKVGAETITYEKQQVIY